MLFKLIYDVGFLLYTDTKRGDSMDTNETIGQRIVDGRKRLGLSREGFAELVGLSAYFVGQIERGVRLMSYDTLLKVSDCLHLSLDYLVKGENQTQADDELLRLVSQCTAQEKALLLDVLKAAMPHLGRLNK
jgi:transcriptional regulator with XRE-family HTH domain